MKSGLDPSAWSYSADVKGCATTLLEVGHSFLQIHSLQLHLY